VDRVPIVFLVRLPRPCEDRLKLLDRLTQAEPLTELGLELLGFLS
jgi:hypothetical protein